MRSRGPTRTVHHSITRHRCALWSVQINDSCKAAKVLSESLLSKLWLQCVTGSLWFSFLMLFPGFSADFWVSAPFCFLFSPRGGTHSSPHFYWPFSPNLNSLHCAFGFDFCSSFSLNNLQLSDLKLPHGSSRPAFGILCVFFPNKLRLFRHLWLLQSSQTLLQLMEANRPFEIWKGYTAQESFKTKTWSSKLLRLYIVRKNKSICCHSLLLFALQMYTLLEYEHHSEFSKA